MPKVDSKPQKDEIFDFSKNRDFQRKPFQNDDFALSNSKISLLRHLFFNYLIITIHGAKHSFFKAYKQKLHLKLT